MGKAIEITSEEDWQNFFRYFVEELLGRGEIASSKVEIQGIPIEKYEELYRELMESEKIKTQYWEKIKRLEEDMVRKDAVIKELEEKQKMAEKRQKEMEEEIQQLVNELKREREEKKLKEITEILSSVSIKEEEKKKILDVIKSVLEGKK